MAKKQLSAFQMMEREARRGYFKRGLRKLDPKDFGFMIVCFGPSMGFGLFCAFFAWIEPNEPMYVKFSALFVGIAVVSVLICFGWMCLRLWAKAGTLSTKEIILAFQRNRIIDARDSAVGEDTAFAYEKTVAEAFLRRLDAVHEQLSSIVCKDPTNDFLLRLKQDVEQKRERILCVQHKRHQFEERVKSYAEDRLTAVCQLESSLSQMELIHEVHALCDQTDEVVSGVEASMAQSLLILADKFAEMQKQIEVAYEETGIAIAVEVAGQNDSFDFARFERVIEQHVPARLETTTENS